MIVASAVNSLVTPSLCVPWVAGVALVITAWAFREDDGAACAWRRGVAAALMAAAVFEVAAGSGAGALAGHRIEEFGAVTTPWTAMVDGVVAVLAAVALWGAPAAGTATSPAARTAGAGASLRGALGVVLAVSGLVHAADFFGIIASLAVLVASLFVASREEARCDPEGSLRAVMWCLLGAALIFAGTSTVDLDRLSSRMMMVFTRWGGAQERLVDLRAGQDVLSGGMLAQLRGEVIRGLAPASLALPGVFIFLAGVLALMGAFPFRLARRRTTNEARTEGLLWLGPVIAGAVMLVSALLEPMHAPRMVREPYGWVGVLPTLGTLTVLVGGARAVAARTVWGCARATVQVGVGVLMLSVAASASFLGQARYVPREAARRTSEEMWARVAAESSLAGGLELFAATVLLCGVVYACVVVARGRAEASVTAEAGDVLTGLVRHAPIVTGCLVVGIACVVGLAPGVGADAWFDVYRGLGQHRGMGWTLGIVGIGHACVGIGLARRVLVVFDGRAEADDDSVPAAGGTARGWVVLLGVCALLGGPLTGAWRSAGTLASGGVGLTVGSERRALWMRAVMSEDEEVAASATAAAAEVSPTEAPKGAETAPEGG